MKNRTIPGHDKITRPSFRVFLGGEDITLKHGIISILVSNHVNRIPQATVVLHDGNAAKGDFELSGGKKQSF
ncbi:MAG: type VI secretion system tip protein VgrG, partial [Bacteroidia bacterium]